MTKANTKTNSGKLTKRDLFRANWRWLWGSQLSWNYERMMAPGYFYAVLPFLKRWYKDDELVEMMQMQTQFSTLTLMLVTSSLVLTQPLKKVKV